MHDPLFWEIMAPFFIFVFICLLLIALAAVILKHPFKILIGFVMMIYLVGSQDRRIWMDQQRVPYDQELPDK